MKNYNHKTIEKKWQKEWEKKKIYNAKNQKGEKFYSLIEFPYPSGDGLHVGHIRSNTAMDIISRKRRMEGYNVLYPIGYDAFGLPTENYAIKTGKQPAEVTKKNTDTFRRQLKEIGFSFDWSREVNTTDPAYYKWTQWIFLQFLKNGLAYKAKSEINWCPKDKIGLANEEVVDGKCERCGAETIKKEKEQWMLAITKYADRLDKDLDLVDYPERVKLSQRNWIGRSEGSEIDFKIKGLDKVKHIVILHGRNGTPNNYSFPWLKKQFEDRGYTVDVPELPNTEEPNDEEQADYVQKHCTLNENTAIVGQSFGGIVAMRLLERGVKVERVVMAVVPFTGKFKDKKIRNSVTSACKKGFNFKIIKKNANEFIVLRDKKDEIMLDEDANLWQKNLNCKLIDGEGMISHFSAEKEPDMVLVSVPTVRVFTTRADTLFGATYVVLAPEHPLVESFLNKIENKNEVEKYISDVKKKSDLERTENKEKTGVELRGVKAINPVNKEEIPIWIADYVLAQYGTGAVMAVPAHDERDFLFAKKFNLGIKDVVAPYWLDEIQKPKKDKETHKREVVTMIVRNPKDNKYLCLKWSITGWQSFPTGGTEGEDLEIAGRRELLEETGYKNLKFVKKIPGSAYAEFWRPHKGSNVFAHFIFLVFDLENDEKVEVEKSEKEKHEVVWIPEDEVLNFINVENQRFMWKRLKDENLIFSDYGVLFDSENFSGMKSEEAKRKITELVGGKIVTRFKLRDWVFSRQRYWGEPIPVINCEKCGLVPVPGKDLPVKLPKVKSYKPTDTGESPLASIAAWLNVKCPKCGDKARRETDTMPNWAGSSWYYLRYTDPKNKKEFASKKNLKYWLDVDWYNGGMEHTTLHLLYSRFWHKFLYDLKLVPTVEPYKKRTSHGMILGEGGVKMSKSLGNVVNPDKIVKTYGADTLRVYEMFMGPFEDAVVWNTDSIIGSRRFIEKVWRIGFKIISETEFPSRGLSQADEPRVSAPRARGDSDPVKENSVKLKKLLHKTIKKVGEDIEAMRFNTAISSMMILATEMEKALFVDIDDFKKFLQILAPFAPHIAEELWTSLGEKKTINLSKWPKYDEKFLIDNELKIMIQVNGKIRGEMLVPINESEEKIKEWAINNLSAKKFIEGMQIKKVIYVKGRLVNIVV